MGVETGQRTPPDSQSTPDIDGLPSESIPPGESGCVVWHRRQLRTSDHPALTYAAREYDTVLPLFVFDPQFYGTDGLACDARIRFLHESLADLDAQYAAVGGQLNYAHGDPIDVLSQLRAAGWIVVATADPTGRYGWQRDNAAAEQCDVTYIDADGLVRGQEDAREAWSDAVESWFTDELLSWDAERVSLAAIETPVTVEAIEAAYDIEPTKTDVPPGGTTAARDRLRLFTDAISRYPGSISAPSAAKTGASRLSASLRFGCLSVREVYQYIDTHATDGRGKSMFISRLYWNRHYNQKLEDWPGWMETAVNPVMEDFHADTADPERFAAWKDGRTGYPMVDASMHCLRATGWLNFRMRAMCASFLCDLLEQPWKPGADWFYYHLIDADPAINYTQFQTQAGMVGVNMLRIYNPRKQVRDNDSDGEFIRQWVPELDSLPTEHLDRPEKTPLHVQADCEVEIGEDYPYPMVEYEAARQRILDRFTAISDAAERALGHPEVARRASLSRRGRSTGRTVRTSHAAHLDDLSPPDDNSRPQTTLSRFHSATESDKN